MSVRGWTWFASGVVIVLAMLAIHQAGEAPSMAFDSLGSATVPYFVGIGLLVLTGIMIVEELIYSRGSATAVVDEVKEEDDREAPGTKITTQSEMPHPGGR